MNLFFKNNIGFSLIRLPGFHKYLVFLAIEAFSPIFMNFFKYIEKNFFKSEYNFFNFLKENIVTLKKYSRKYFGNEVIIDPSNKRMSLKYQYFLYVRNVDDRIFRRVVKKGTIVFT